MGLCFCPSCILPRETDGSFHLENGNLGQQPFKNKLELMPLPPPDLSLHSTKWWTLQTASGKDGGRRAANTLCPSFFPSPFMLNPTAERPWLCGNTTSIEYSGKISLGFFFFPPRISLGVWGASDRQEEGGWRERVRKESDAQCLELSHSELGAQHTLVLPRQELGPFWQLLHEFPEQNHKCAVMSMTSASFLR